MPLAPLALDNYDFPSLRAKGQIYVDKTSYIQQMLEEGTTYAFLARPRRFGKSLLLSTLAHLFGRAHDDPFRELDIAGYLPQVPQVPVVTLDMARITGHSPPAVRAALTHLVRDQACRAGLPASADATPWIALDNLFSHLQRRHGKFAVLVDEYDAPLTSLLTKPSFTPQDRQETQADLRDFYRTLKTWNSAIQFAFVTGIVQIASAGLFSALNNLRNLSSDPVYDTACGFTEAEIDRFLRPHIDAAAQHFACTGEALRETLRRHYNGYRFSLVGEPVYNPISYLTALAHLTVPKRAQAIRLSGFPRPWADTGEPYFLFHLMQARGQTLQDVDYSAGGAQSALDLQRPTLNALMYQTGYLTLTREQGATRLDFPNLEVEASFQEELFCAYLGKPAGSDSPERARVRELSRALQRGDCGAAIACFDQILDRVSYTELEAESNFQIALHIVCAMARSVLRVATEVPSRRGRADAVVETADAVYVFALKLNKTLKAATDQIKARGYREKYAATGKRVMGIGLNFIKPKETKGAWQSARGNYEWALLPLQDEA